VGRVAAAPILFDAFARLPLGSQPLPPAPKGALITTTAKLPPPLQRFSPNRLTGAELTSPVHIAFPPDGASLELSSNEGEMPDPVPIKITGGTPPLNVLLNGMPLDTKSGTRTLFFAPDGPGFVRLTVTDATGAADSVMVRLQ
jgi:penicillin-binding protein 1C